MRRKPTRPSRHSGSTLVGSSSDRNISSFVFRPRTQIFTIADCAVAHPRNSVLCPSPNLVLFYILTQTTRIQFSGFKLSCYTTLPPLQLFLRGRQKVQKNNRTRSPSRRHLSASP